jgi:hypothetical protein
MKYEKNLFPSHLKFLAVVTVLFYFGDLELKQKCIRNKNYKKQRNQPKFLVS